ncbi:hypothetical protein [Allokutzneria sp. NRRL B-24872]|uniref:hypothetical protein n=1 Tax=Allokutzneria sp. NRRL B-24872 TaxID=1137961 RepID=UPI000A3D5BB9|nr:hypothetical protein [Allokutzneria sp. NRRL B-24872]
MTSSLADELNARAVDTDGVHQAIRYYLAERLDDLPPEDMLDRMYEVAGRARVDRARADLARDQVLLESGALAVLSEAWAEEAEQDRVRAVLTGTKGKLPVVEVAMLAIVCMYGMYLLATGGRKKSTTTTVRKPDGSFESRETIEYADPTRPLGAIAGIFRRSEPRAVESAETVKQSDGPP